MHPGRTFNSNGDRRSFLAERVVNLAGALFEPNGREGQYPCGGRALRDQSVVGRPSWTKAVVKFRNARRGHSIHGLAGELPRADRNRHFNGFGGRQWYLLGRP